MALGVDPHSYANFKEVVVTHLHICLKADFAAKSLSGYVDLTAKVLVDGTQELLLDTNQLEVTKVVDLKENEQPLQFTKPREQNEQLGVPLSIPIPENSRRAGTHWLFKTWAHLFYGGGKFNFVNRQCTLCFYSPAQIIIITLMLVMLTFGWI